MALQTPPPPSISPRQLTLMRVVASMAWSDGDLAVEEVGLMLKRFSALFAQDGQHQEQLQQELRDYLTQNIPLEELVPKLQSEEERELVLRLGYEVISSSARTPDESLINPEEEEAYQRLLQLVDLPADTVQRLEAEAKTAAESSDSVVDSLTNNLKQFFNR